MKKYKIIKIKQFSVFHIFSSPERIESKIVFDRDNISQKLIFTLMNIVYSHGLGCSAPKFNDSLDSSMTFHVNIILPTKRSLNRCVKKMYECLVEIYHFAQDFNKQLDFSMIDLTMFMGVDTYNFYPEQIAAIRDQHFNGSWNEFKKALLIENKEKEANMIDRCKKFEKMNKKDIGYVGHKLNYTIEMINNLDPDAISN